MRKGILCVVMLAKMGICLFNILRSKVHSYKIKILEEADPSWHRWILSSQEHTECTSVFRTNPPERHCEPIEEQLLYNKRGPDRESWGTIRDLGS